VLADEPTGARDKTNAAALFAIRGGLARQGRTAIAVTQDKDLAAAQQRVHVVDGLVARVEVQG
jgi:ABC-type lipoprotein export system ATPase subunit